jgi:hypothetical protein
MELSKQKPHGVHTKPFFGATRCGALTRQQKPCGAAIRNGRCRFHGGLSTGPKTPEGIERIRRARTIHGRYSVKAKAEQRAYRALLKECRAALAELGLVYMTEKERLVMRSWLLKPLSETTYSLMFRQVRLGCRISMKFADFLRLRPSDLPSASRMTDPSQRGPQPLLTDAVVRP